MPKWSVLAIAAIPAWPQCSGILSWEEYRSVRHSFPYVLRLPAGKGELLMFGARHTSDPRDPQIAAIERLWEEYGPDLAFSEGGVRPSSPSRDVAVERFGEPGLVRFLADRGRVPLRNLEPPRSWKPLHWCPGRRPGM